MENITFDSDLDDSNQDDQIFKSNDVKSGLKKSKDIQIYNKKLSLAELKTIKGLPFLYHQTANKINQLKGSTYELHDAKVLLKLIREWHLNLSPSLKFKDFLKKLEKIGKQKDAQFLFQEIFNQK